jgi:two-component system, sensor histidine kinase RpfC
LSLVSWIKTRLASRADTELEQALLRVLIGIGIGIYLPRNANDSTEWLYTSGAYVIVIAAFMLSAFVIVACILFWPRPSPARRVIANVLDIVTLTFIMIGGNDHTAPLFFIYLWVTFGCGFRFGANYLLISLTLSIFGFLAVIRNSTAVTVRVHVGQTPIYRARARGGCKSSKTHVCLISVA